MNKQNVAIYCHSLIEESYLKEYAIKIGYEIYGTYIDIEYSENNPNRPILQSLLKDVRLKKFNTVLIWKVDGLSPRIKDVVNIIEDDLEPNDINLLVCAGNIDSNKIEGKLFIEMLCVFESYKDKL